MDEPDTPNTRIFPLRKGGSVYASMTTTRGSSENMAEIAEMVGETMVDWLRDIEGFGGLLMLSNEDTGTTHVIALWESEEIAEHHREARLRLRDQVTSTVGVEVLETVPYDVTFAHLRGTRVTDL